MNGTYFFQLELFEDESAGVVTIPKSKLGSKHDIHFGRTVESILRTQGHTAAKLAAQYDESFVCIRRFRNVDRRLLPLVLDELKLLKYECEPSALGMRAGIVTLDRKKEKPAAKLQSEEAVVFSARGAEPHELERALRLFSIYLASGGAYCMRAATWRKITKEIHPDKGKDVHVFQLLMSLKLRVDRGDLITIPNESLGLLPDNMGTDNMCLALLRADWERKLSQRLFAPGSSCIDLAMEAETRGAKRYGALVAEVQYALAQPQAPACATPRPAPSPPAL